MRDLGVLVVVVVVALSGCSSEGSSSAVTTSEASTTSSMTTSRGDETPAVDVAMSAIDAWNEHDFAAFQSVFTSDGLYDGFPIGDADTEDEFSFWTGLGDTVSVLECMVVTADNPLGLDAGGVACLINGVDELSGTVGMNFKGNAAMNIVDGKVRSYDWFGIEASKINYTTEMVEWVRDHHTDTFQDVFADPACNPGRLNCWGDWATSAPAADALLELHGEYRTWLDHGSGEASDLPYAPDPMLRDPSFDVQVSSIDDPSTNTVWAYQPKGEGPWPIVFAIPGSDGDARGFDTVATELARRGVLVFATEIADDAERSISDVECGYRLAREAAADLGGDLALPVLMYGHSQGATRALEHTLGAAVFGPEGSITACPEAADRPSGAVAIAGCHNYWGFGSDTTMWGNDSAVFTLAAGTEDTQCNLNQTIAAYESLTEAGYQASAYAIQGGTHGGLVFRDPSNPEEQLPADHVPGQQVIMLILDTIEAIAAK